MGVAVLYLGGQARSGSTLLERALGQIPTFWSSGEVRYLWDRGLIENQRCGCGQPLRDCAFWTSVGERAFGGWDRIDPRSIRAWQQRVDRNRYVPAMLATPLAPAYRRNRRRLIRPSLDESSAFIPSPSTVCAPEGATSSCGRTGRLPTIGRRASSPVADRYSARRTATESNPAHRDVARDQGVPRVAVDEAEANGERSYFDADCASPTAAWPAARRAVSTRNGEQLT
jgi:hypothetical protein